MDVVNDGSRYENTAASGQDQESSFLTAYLCREILKVVVKGNLPTAEAGTTSPWMFLA